ncbi:MAG: hypothetical protein ACTHKF_05750 [Candidatus Nitrosocosmicus sp.]
MKSIHDGLGDLCCAIAIKIGFNYIIKEKLNFFTEALQIQVDR